MTGLSQYQLGVREYSSRPIRPWDARPLLNSPAITFDNLAALLPWRVDWRQIMDSELIGPILNYKVASQDSSLTCVRYLTQEYETRHG